jgi:hypothetical protein
MFGFMRLRRMVRPKFAATPPGSLRALPAFTRMLIAQDDIANWPIEQQFDDEVWEISLRIATKERKSTWAAGVTRDQ